jgi:Zn-dependent peptidase ImmA (M78 family)/transcriptional regulator with XRE-family HTH domain
MPLTKEELGQRIRAAREACGLTQEQLGEPAGLSRLAIGQIESGTRTVSSIELDRIAYAVGRDIKSFFAETFEERDALAALFRSDSALAEQTELLRALRDSLTVGREMTNLEHLLGIDRAQLLTAAYELPVPNSRWDAIQQGQKIATEERQRLGLGSSPVTELGELLETQGVRTAIVRLPDNISGLTLSDKTLGAFIVINAGHSELRRRFSLAHEYAHVLLDRDRSGAISRAENRADLFEVRANAFAAEFLMPMEGVAQFIQALGKGAASRAQIAVFDEAEAIQVEQRATPGSQEIQLYDVALLAHHFAASRISALYRLKNLRLIDEREFQSLKTKEDAGAGKAIADFLAAPERSREDSARDDFRRRFLGLALEAYRREEITRSKLSELAAMVGMRRDEVRAALTSANLD